MFDPPSARRTGRATAAATAAAATCCALLAWAQTPEVVGWSYVPLDEAQVTELRGAIGEMEELPRGPYSRLRWFCNDGTVLAPQPYACRPHGGGRQHAEYTDAARRYASWGFHFGPILAATDFEHFNDLANGHYFLRELLVQAYLERIDDGWVMRRARYYRGARQAEDEEATGREYLARLLDEPGWIERHYMLGGRLVEVVPHGQPGVPGGRIRALAKQVSDADPGFVSLRVKIHSSPGPEDLAAVSEYRAVLPSDAEPEVVEVLDELIADLESRYSAGVDPARWAALSEEIQDSRARRRVSAIPVELQDANRRTRVRVLSRLVHDLRESLALASQAGNGDQALALLDTIRFAEAQLFVEATTLMGEFERDGSTRRELLVTIGELVDACYGTGWLSRREHAALRVKINDALRAETEFTRGEYGALATYLSRAAEWGAATVQQAVALVVGRYAAVEPMVHGFRDDAVRGSLLLPLSDLLGRLALDAATVAGMQHLIIDELVPAGVVGLNAGVASGPLYVLTSASEIHNLDPDGIYVLPETPATLGRVAGIITLDQGSRLSHVQLLARGMGIPNAAISSDYLELLQQAAGQPVAYAVSPLGSTILTPLATLDSEDQRLFRDSASDLATSIEIDVNSLDLDRRSVLDLRDVGADDSGRIVGPKAANLGQLYRLFPDRVAPGLVIPFGIFRWHADRDLNGDGRTLYEEIVDIYETSEDPDRVLERLAQVQDQIRTMELIPEFAADLVRRLGEDFGSLNESGVFVRSDTNVEDLPGFSGAGLNLTEMNVVGIDAVLQAVRDVWASPFSARSYAWRQQAIKNPEAVYPSIVILGSVASEASGVLVTDDVDRVSASGDAKVDGWTVTLSQGVAGAVEGEPTEAYLVSPVADGFEPVLLSSARATWRKQLDPHGGIVDIPIDGDLQLLTPERLPDFRAVVDEIIERYPAERAPDGNVMPWDIEFGFLGQRTLLFQIRPFVVNVRTGALSILTDLDRRVRESAHLPLDLDQPLPRQ